MRQAILLPLAAVLSLAACNKAGSGSGAGGTAAAGNGASLPEKAAAAIADVSFQPGLYESQVDIKAFDMPGLPPAAIAGMKGSMARKPMTYCLSPEDAAKGAEAMKRHMGNGHCQFDKFNVAGGTIDTSMSCQMGQGTLTGQAHGTYTDTGTVVNSVAEMTMPGGRKMHIEEVVTTKRVGDCSK